MTALDSGRGPLVSVIIPTKNRSDLLRQALASVRAIDGPDLRLEVIVADNGSTDTTADVAAAFGARFVQTRVPGAAAARNAGLRAATGAFLAFLDDDDVWFPAHLRPHLALLAARPELAAVVGQARNTTFDLSSAGDPWPTGLPDDGDLFPALLTLCPQIGATVARSSVRETVGLFDEALLGDEDWDWHLRLALRHRVGFVPAPSIRFRQRPTSARDDLRWVRLGFSRRVYVANVARAVRAGRRLSPAGVLVGYLRHRGGFAYDFLTSAGDQVDAGNRPRARLALLRALGASPLHVARALVRDRRVRRTIALACTTPPGGQKRGTLQLLADRLVALRVVERISNETVRRTLKRGT